MPPVGRKEFLIGFTAVFAASCGFYKSQGEGRRREPQLSELPPLEKLREEVQRIAQTFPTDSYVYRIYTGDLKKFSSVFKPSVYTNFSDLIDPQNTRGIYTQVRFGNAVYSPNNRFRFTDGNGNSRDFATLKEVFVMIYFSKNWLNTRHDAIKALAMQKEAANVLLWDTSSALALTSYKSSGKLENLDKEKPVTDLEMAQTLTMRIKIDSPEAAKITDYAGYLAVMHETGRIIESGDQELIAELEKVTNLANVYRRAQAQKIPLENLAIGTTQFNQIAFGKNSPWVQMILDPSLPGPY